MINDPVKHPWEADSSADCMKDFIEVMREKFSPAAFRLRYESQNIPLSNEEMLGSILIDMQNAMRNHLPVAVIDRRCGEYCHADYIKSIEPVAGDFGNRVMCKMEDGIMVDIFDVRIINQEQLKQIKQQ